MLSRISLEYPSNNSKFELTIVVNSKIDQGFNQKHDDIIKFIRSKLTTKKSITIQITANKHKLEENTL